MPMWHLGLHGATHTLKHSIPLRELSRGVDGSEVIGQSTMEKVCQVPMERIGQRTDGKSLSSVDGKNWSKHQWKEFIKTSNQEKI
jgi:hypothetical protein